MLQETSSRCNATRKEKQAMRKTHNAANAIAKKRWATPAERMSYQHLVGCLAAEMAECVRSEQTSEFCAPFQLVIVDPQGAVVFQGEVSEDGNIHHNGPSRVVRRSHFPATALLTDRSLVTRTFRIERAF